METLDRSIGVVEMKLYIDTKKMTFEEDNIEHEIILKVSDKEFYGYDRKLNHPKELVVREGCTWNSFPLYEIINNKIVSFDYTKYQYFADTDRRMALAFKINELYNPSSEAKILRKTLKHIMDALDIAYPDYFEKYDIKIDAIAEKNPK